MNVLFICTGNTCRSPMAEAIMKSKDEEASVKSAGIFAGLNQPVGANTHEVLAEIGLSFDNTSTPVTQELLEWSDIVLCMTESHKQTLALQYPDLQHKFFTLKEYVLIDEDQWRHLTDLYAQFEEKRAWVLSQADENLNEVELEQFLLKELDEEIKAIQQAEQELPNLNIIDPYGQSVQVYRETRDELEKTIEGLVDKLKYEKE
ncbi:low molecular weight protein arginine phosphatase [Halobacillus sp. A5]|uniref:low molecular weight protein arginine phosphatase n=1 Tax=Halobacillus sp. A5 TaxID=2880263 RepID=UPI0020A644C6|nr:low molecular weight protein arginine phosphatase [Halobacillus sp. A5]MCP3027570.1 low molecular weight protein arginine phosphatase [Halobacillus sp. A5]